MYITDKMIANGYTGVGHSQDRVAEYTDGRVTGLYVDREKAGIDLLWVDINNDISYNGGLIVEHTPEGVIIRCGELELTTAEE